MEFTKFKQNLTAHFSTISAKYPLYETDIDKDHLWNLYLDSFPEGTNPIFRERRTYDCSCCRQFIKNIGGTVYIDENLDVHSIFEFDAGSTTFQTVADALSAYVKSCPIADIYLNESANVGTDENRELLDDGKVFTWNHLHVKLPNNLVAPKDKIPSNKARIRDRINVFERCLKEISMDAIDTILELISANTLYKGEEWKNQIQKLRDFKAAYIDIPDDKKHAYALRTGFGIDDVIGKIRNHSIGVLLIDISEGMDLDAAVRRYEQIVAPTNYKRPKAIYTKKMLEDAKKTVSELGYMDSLQRRYATLDDITVNNILFSNRDAAKRISGDIFDEMISEAGVNPKKFSRVEEVSAEKFIKDILPSAKSLEVLFENKHAKNMVSLIAPVNKDAKSMFKWANGFSWAYTGNITDSVMRENVKAAGGDVDGDLRFSIQWNDESHNPNDFDAHCIEPLPFGRHIYFSNKGYRHPL